MAGCTGIDSTLVFSGATAFATRWKSVSGIRQFVDALEDTDLQSTNYKRFCPDDLAEIDAFDIEFYWEGAAGDYPVVGETHTVTLTVSPNSGQSNGGVFTGTAFIQEWTSPDLEAGTRKTGTCQVRFDGAGFTYTAAS